MSINPNIITSLQDFPTTNETDGPDETRGRRPWKDDEIWATPDEAYRDNSGLNDAARGFGRYDTLGFDPCKPGFSQYGKVRVTETEGGHQIIMDDTLGHERILIKHSSGKSGIEFRPDGSILITATTIDYQVGGHVNMNTSGNFNVTSGGNMMVDAAGLEQTIAGDISTKTSGTMTEEMNGRKISKIGKDKLETVAGNNFSTTVGSKMDLGLGGSTIAVKGDMKINVDGTSEHFASGDMNVTAEGRSMMAADKVAINGTSQLEVVSDNGTLGGDNIMLHAYNAKIGHTLSAGDTITTQSLKASKTLNAPTITGDKVVAGYMEGDLKGTAEFSGGTGTFSGSDPGGDAEVADDTGDTQRPTADVMTARASTKLNGIRKVKVDRGDYIKAAINRSVATGGTFS